MKLISISLLFLVLVALNNGWAQSFSGQYQRFPLETRIINRYQQPTPYQFQNSRNSIQYQRPIIEHSYQGPSLSSGSFSGNQNVSPSNSSRVPLCQNVSNNGTVWANDGGEYVCTKGGSEVLKINGNRGVVIKNFSHLYQNPSEPRNKIYQNNTYKKLAPGQRDSEGRVSILEYNESNDDQIVINSNESFNVKKTGSLPKNRLLRYINKYGKKIIFFINDDGSIAQYDEQMKNQIMKNSDIYDDELDSLIGEKVEFEIDELSQYVKACQHEDLAGNSIDELNNNIQEVLDGESDEKPSKPFADTFLENQLDEADSADDEQASKEQAAREIKLRKQKVSAIANDLGNGNVGRIADYNYAIVGNTTPFIFNGNVYYNICVQG